MPTMRHLDPYATRRIGLFTWKGLIQVQRIILIASSSFVVLLVFAAVVMRYVIHYPGMEVEEIATLVAFWLYFTGAVYGSYERSHIKADLADVIFKNPKANARVKVIASVIVFILALTMTYWGYVFFVWGIEMHARSPVLLLPMVYAQSSIFVGAMFMSFYFFVELVDTIRKSRGLAPLPWAGVEKE
jgi:TRAP-type C4-dicarboxylate transport system permease small subunit